MGGTVGIEAARLEALDYDTVRASGLAFGTAHSVLQRSLKKAKSINVADDQTTIHFLAIRQLSHNLKNQKILEKTRHKVLKTKSVPHNVKYRQHSFEIDGVLEHVDGENGTPADGEGEVEPDLSNDDLDLVHDDEYYHHHHNHKETPSIYMDDGPPWNFAEQGRHDKGASQDREAHAAGEGQHKRGHGHESQDREDAKSSNSAEAASATSPVAVAAAAPKGRKPRPVLSLQLTSPGVSSNALATDVTVSNNVSTIHPLKQTHSKSQHAAEPHDSSGAPQPHLPRGAPPSPSANVRVSPRGTLYMGKWKVMETGIFPDESILNSSHRANNTNSNNGIHQSSSVGAGLGASQGGQFPARAHNSSSSNNMMGSIHKLGASSAAFASSVRRQAPLPAIGGKRDFLEICTLGSGASGVVSEAIHLPSLTIVALKMLPVYNQEKRQHVSRELGVLYKNLAELRLVDDSLYQEGKDGKDGAAAVDGGPAGAAGKVGLGGVSSPHILSLYNAFVDPKSGMINLVIEYMDGGSLEDLVQQGGCADEKVLADIAYQTTKGLAFLHANKSVHRDIKPANILWSTSGMIKIGDFGISKALDKTSGFANSFVGTVSYMSPERITGESYGFSCDIWSLGLTLLAVAKGRFPLNTKEAKNNPGDGDSPTESTGSPQQIVGGAAGYWAMIQAICDDEPPCAGPSYSAEFNAFIDACLKKDPAARLSSKQLLAMPFIEKNAASLKMSFSDLQARRSKIDGTPAGHAASAGQDADCHAVADTHRDAKEEGAALAVDTTRPHDLQVAAVPPSPLTTRLTNVAIVRRTAQEYPVFESPTNRSRRLSEAEAKAPEGGPGSDTASADAIPEEGEEAESDMARIIEGNIAANDVIIAIRLEHLERVLDRIAHRLRSGQRRVRRTRSDSGDEVEDGGAGEEEDDGYDDTQDHDLTDIHHYGDEFGEVRDDALLQPHDSVDSMDKLLQYKDAEPSPPPLQLPAGKFASRRAVDVAEAKQQSRAEEAVRGEKPDKLAGAGEKEQLGPSAPGEVTGHDEKPHHGILKGVPHHTHPLPGHAADEPMRAEEKKAVFAAARGRSSGSSAFNSNRSVHFLGGGADEHGPPHTHAHPHGHHVSILGVAESGSADLDEDAGEPAASALTHPSLPKTSSYFVQSRFQRQDHGDAKDGGDVGDDADSDENDAMAVVDHAIAVSEAVSQAVLEEPSAPLQVDYCRMLPKLNSRGLPKWENLARQLHLPLHLVKLAVRSRLGGLLDLEAEEEEDGDADGAGDGDDAKESAEGSPTEESPSPLRAGGRVEERREEKEQ